MTRAVDYRGFASAPPLASWVECFWSARREASGDGRPPQRILPDGCIDLVLQVAGEPDLDVREPAVAVGTMTRPLWLRHAGAVEHFGVRFRPAMV